MDVVFSLQNINTAAKTILSNLANNTVLALHAPMGTGKTTLTTALCKSLGVVDVVSSPTFSIINEYKTTEGKTIYHLDLYRLKDEQEAVNAGVEDCLFSNDLCIVEWPEKLPAIFPENTLHIKIELLETGGRKISTI